MWDLLGSDPSQWSTILAGQGISPDALGANAQAQPGAEAPSPWEPVQPLPGEPGGAAGPAQTMPGMPGGPAGPLAPSPNPAAPSSPAAPGGGPALVNALRGMVAPNVPQPQRVSSPSAPHPSGKIEGGGLVSLLGQLGMLRGAQMPSSYQLPSTLGAALGGH